MRENSIHYSLHSLLATSASALGQAAFQSTDVVVLLGGSIVFIGSSRVHRMEPSSRAPSLCDRRILRKFRVTYISRCEIHIFSTHGASFDRQWHQFPFNEHAEKRMHLVYGVAFLVQEILWGLEALDAKKPFFLDRT